MTEVFVPVCLEEALALRADRPDAVPVAGGTDLLVELAAGRTPPPALLDLSRLAELRRWQRDETGRLFVGAGVTFARIANELPELTALAAAARSVGSPPIRNRATIGGNLATASPAGDALPVLAAYDADVVTASSTATRKLPLAEFLVGPKRTALRRDELILGVEWREHAGAGGFAKVGPRTAVVIAIAGVALQLDREERLVRVGLGSVAPTAVRAPEAERFARAVVPWGDGRLADEDAREFGRLAAAAAAPIDDLRGTAAYRRRAVEVLARRLLAETVAC